MQEWRGPRVGVALLALVWLGACEFHVGPLQKGPAGGAAADGASSAPRGEVWAYTSIYQSVIEELDVLIAEELPEVQVRWYRAGSEKVATRLDTELRAGGTQADLVLTSDPFWYRRLEKEGRLATHVNVPMLAMPRDYLDTKGHWSTCRVSTMVIAYHPDLIGGEALPKRFGDLVREDLAGKVTLGDPLSSGTHFTTTAFLSRRYGWDFYKTLRAQKALASGGNSSVLRRIEGREYPVGVVLLESVLANQAKGSPVKYVVPEDGAVTIPGYAALLKTSDNPTAARAVYALLLSEAGQRMMVKGYMHSALPGVPPPSGAPTFEEVSRGEFQWTPELIDAVQQEAPKIKTTFDAIMNRGEEAP